MPSTRRDVLVAASRGAAAVAVVGAGALGWRLHASGLIGGSDAPFDPWSSYSHLPAGEPLSLVGAAILAASPHNTQPWRFEVGPAAIDLFAEPARHLGSFDPARREMWLGLGCAVENMVQAAGDKGFVIDSVVPAPGDRDGNHAARLTLRPAGRAPSRLAAAIATRRTNRGDYRIDAPIADDVIATLRALPSSADTRLLLVPAATETGRAFAEGTIAATQAIAADATMSGDSLRWLRGDAREVALHRDGLSIPAAGLAPWRSIVGQLLPTPSGPEADAYWIDSTRRQVGTAAGFGLLLVRSLHDRRQQIEAGRLWQRIQLALTFAGVASQPLNQMMEQVDRSRQLGRPSDVARQLAGWSGAEWSATFAFRLGHATRQVPHSARRGVASVAAATRP